MTNAAAASEAVPTAAVTRAAAASARQQRQRRRRAAADGSRRAFAAVTTAAVAAIATAIAATVTATSAAVATSSAATVAARHGRCGHVSAVCRMHAVAESATGCLCLCHESCQSECIPFILTILIRGLTTQPLEVLTVRHVLSLFPPARRVPVRRAGARSGRARARHLGLRVRGERLHRGAEMVWGSVEGGESKVFKLASSS